jgi:hypothetical protein
VIDRQFVTSREPSDISAFNRAMLAVFGEVCERDAAAE